MLAFDSNASWTSPLVVARPWLAGGAVGPVVWVVSRPVDERIGEARHQRGLDELDG